MARNAEPRACDECGHPFDWHDEGSGLCRDCDCSGYTLPEDGE
jgi:NMD protein affecting ribosome stability and mRNA decay